MRALVEIVFRTEKTRHDGVAAVLSLPSRHDGGQVAGRRYQMAFGSDLRLFGLASAASVLMGLVLLVLT
ncbi:hypothetical protein EOD29_33020, partial [Mesorhizobium sp. M1A.T.Ca.IN.004.03.1.1]